MPKIRSGFYLENLSNIIKHNEKVDFLTKRRFTYPSIHSQYVNKIHTYLYKVSDVINLYILLVGEEYTVVVEDFTQPDKEEYGYLSKNVIHVPIYNNKIGENFWKQTISKLDKGIQREILIKNILKSK
jgi:hypothetical protein